MKTVTIEIKGLLSALSALGIEKQLMRLPGVHTAAVNYVAGSTTVGYDETATDLQTIVAWVDECGYHCAGSLPRVGVRFKACRISMRARIHRCRFSPGGGVCACRYTGDDPSANAGLRY